MEMDHGKISYGRNISGTLGFILLIINKKTAFWSDMLHVKDLYLCGRKMQEGDGSRTHLRGDGWCGHSPLKEIFPDLLAICNE
jgi:hypothetical protein